MFLMKSEYYILKYKLKGVEGSIYKDFWTNLSHTPHFESLEDAEQFYLANKKYYDTATGNREIGVFRIIRDEIYVSNASELDKKDVVVLN